MKRGKFDNQTHKYKNIESFIIGTPIERKPNYKPLQIIVLFSRHFKEKYQARLCDVASGISVKLQMNESVNTEKIFWITYVSKGQGIRSYL